MVASVTNNGIWLNPSTECQLALMYSFAWKGCGLYREETYPTKKPLFSVHVFSLSQCLFLVCNLIFLSSFCTAFHTLKRAIIAWSGGSIWKRTSEILQSCRRSASVSFSQNAISTKRKELEGQQREMGAVWRLLLYSTMSKTYNVHKEKKSILLSNHMVRVAFRSATRSGWGNVTQRQRGQEEGRSEPRVFTTMYSTVLPR